MIDPDVQALHRQLLAGDDPFVAGLLADRYEELGDTRADHYRRVAAVLPKLVNVGPDRAGTEWPGWLEGYSLVVYHYKAGDYDGSGWAVGLRDDGLLDAGNLGHCSCNGPLDAWGQPEYKGITLDRLKALAGDPESALSDDALLKIVAEIERRLTQVPVAEASLP